MFCTSCGSKLHENAVYCGNCGSATGAPQHSPAANRPPAVMSAGKKPNKNRFYIAIAAVVIVAIIAFTQLGNGGELSGTWENNAEDVVIEFRGNRFTVTVYGRLTGLFGATLESVGDFPAHGAERELLSENQSRRVANGTFSISDDRIELIYSEGTIVVFPFSSTENTIDINRARFTRR